MEITTSQILSPGIQETINSIVNSINAGQTIIFCGAGISRDSGFPVANELVSYILLTLCTSIEEIPTIEVRLKTSADSIQYHNILKRIIAKKMNVTLKTINKIENNMPFEAFIEILCDNSEINEILKIYDARAYTPNVKPNNNHILLAKLAASGKVRTIVTTNFDQLIEISLEQQGMQKGRDFDVIYREKDFNRIDWTQHRCRLIKIHGTIDDRREIVDITMRQITRQELSAARASIIRHVFSQGDHKQVLVLGYSCSDQFDLSPQIQSIAENFKRVCLVQHYNNPKIENICKQKEKNPFKAFAGSNRLFFDTPRLIELLWKTTLEEPYHDSDAGSKKFETSPDWKSRVQRWYIESTQVRSESMKDIITGKLFNDICEWRSSILRYERVLAYAKMIANERIEVTALGNMGIAYSSLGEFRKSIKLLEMAGEIDHRLKEQKGERNALNQLGLVYLGLDEYKKAIGYFERTLEINRKMRDEEGEGGALNNIGLTYIDLGLYGKAIEFFNQAQKIANRVGDIKGIRNTLGNLAIAYNNLRKYDEAIEFCKKALDIDRHIGDPQGENRDLNTMGGTHLELGECSKAIKLFEQSLEIAHRIGDIQSESDSLGNLGVAYRRISKYRKSIGFFEQSLKLARRISHSQNEAGAFYNMGLTYMLMSDNGKAVQAFEQSMNIFKKLQLPNKVDYIMETMKLAGLL